jgi:hypothetical protein
MIRTQHAIFVDRDPLTRVSIIADDRDVLCYLSILHHYAAQNLQYAMMVQPAIHD